MKRADIPSNETERIAALKALNVLDTPAERAFDDLVSLAAAICGTPIALVSLVDRERQWFKARLGLEVSETPRDVAFCAHAINEPDKPFVVGDATKDPRFHDNPLVVDAPSVRFYAGQPLVTADGAALGTLCVIDREARELTPTQLDALQRLGGLVMDQLQLRTALIRQEAMQRQLAEVAERAEESSRLKSKFLASVPHELRTPLHGVVGALDLMEAQRLTPGLGKLHRLAQESAQKLRQLLSNVVVASTLQAGELKLAPAVVVTRDFLERLEVAFRPAAREKSLALKVACDPAVPERIFADEERLFQVLANLVDNALKFTAAGSVSVTATLAGGGESAGLEERLELRVSDTGSGFSPQQFEQATRRFRSLHDSAYTCPDGAGLGLYVAQELATWMGAPLSLLARPGGGSCFLLKLPLVPPFENTREPQSKRPSVGRALVAEDNPVNQRIIKRMLARLDLPYDLVENGADAVEQALKRAYDVILMDLQMPVLDGVEAARRLRAADYRGPIIAVSANIDLYDETVMDGCLPKPFKLQDLQRHLSQHRTEGAR